MRRAELPTPRSAPLAAALRWHVTLRRAHLKLAQRSVSEYAGLQCRMHWRAWSHCR